MNFEITKDDFLKALTKVQGIIEKRHTIPILANVLLETRNNELLITATDLEVGLKTKFPCRVEEEGKVTVSAKKLFEIIKELPNSTVQFSSKNNFWVEIKCEKSLFNLVGLSPEDFPRFPEITENVTDLESALFIEMIDKTIFSVSNDETKFNLTGIYIKYEVQDTENKLTFVSTDGHRLSMITKNMKTELDDNFAKGFILPKKGIFEIRKLIENTDENIGIGISDNNFIVRYMDTVLVMRLVDGEFPDYTRVIPQKTENYALINKDDFLHALKRISILSSEKSKGIKINFKNDLLILSSSNPELGDAKEEIDTVYNGQEISIGFNAKYIIDILQVIKSENIVFYLKDNISPGRISPEKDEDHLSVIMPMRL